MFILIVKIENILFNLVKPKLFTIAGYNPKYISQY